MTEPNTKRLYGNFLILALYSASKRSLSMDQLVAKLQSKELDVCDILQDILNFLASKQPAISHNTKIHMFKVIKTFLECWWKND